MSLIKTSPQCKRKETSDDSQKAEHLNKQSAVKRLTKEERKQHQEIAHPSSRNFFRITQRKNKKISDVNTGLPARQRTLI